MPEEELNLIQFASGQVTESRTRAAEIVWRESFDAGVGRGAQHLRIATAILYVALAG